jgi:hypothetical protein
MYARPLFIVFISIWSFLAGRHSHVLAQADTYKTGDRVEVFYPQDGQYYAAEIVSVEIGGFRVRYDGYITTANELIKPERIRPIQYAAPFINLAKGENHKLTGNLSGGNIIPLQWAALSNMACFPATRFVEFEGKHIFYMAWLPAHSSMDISVNATDGRRINLYAYSGADYKSLPPQVSSCVSCEAAYPLWAGNNPPSDFTKTAGIQKVALRAVNKGYLVLIAVAGAKGVEHGSFELNISIR